MRDKGYHIQGIILKRKNYSEADKIITIFTRQKGKISCLAKGIRRINSKKAPLLELFNQVKAYVVKGRGFDLITEAEVVESFAGIQKKLGNISSAYYLVELVERLTAENQENLTVYQLLLEILEKLNKEGRLKLSGLEQFQKDLLVNLGFGLPPAISLEENKASLDVYIENILNRKINSRHLGKW